MNTKYIPLVVAITLPLAFVVLLALVILVPNMRVKPQHDFVYSTVVDQKYGYYNNQGVQYKNTYDLKDDKIVLKPFVTEPVSKDPYAPVITFENAPTIYYYDMKNQSSREISFEDAQEFSLQKGPSSPDGYTISYDTYNEGIFEIFGSNSRNSSNFVIGKGNGKKPLLGIVNDMYYYQTELNVIGWIK